MPTLLPPILESAGVLRAAPAAGPGESTPELSLVVPAYNEEANLRLLYQRILEVFGARQDWELLLVDDGSRDGTTGIIRALVREDPRVVGVLFAKNSGQTAAMAAGIHHARGRLVATLDADLQNDPVDLPAMIERMDAPGPELDAVVGYRVGRQDTWVRKASSRIANSIRNRLSGDSIRDTGCSLKVFRAEAIRSIPWFEGMHRFLPTLLRYQGYTVVEHPVSHHPRHAGVSKYGIRNRAWRAFKDLLAVRWMRERMIRFPIQDVLRAGTPRGR